MNEERILKKIKKNLTSVITELCTALNKRFDGDIISRWKTNKKMKTKTKQKNNLQDVNDKYLKLPTDHAFFEDVNASASQT